MKPAAYLLLPSEQDTAFTLFIKAYHLGQYGVNGNGPVWWLPKEKMWSEDVMIKGEELEELKEKLRSELDKLIK